MRHQEPPLGVGELARQAGVSIRTLRHYDAIGLLQPSHRGENHYRYYTDNDRQRLFDILFYRALGFALQDIAQLLSRPVPDRRRILLAQKEQLAAHMQRLQRIGVRLDELLATAEESNMSRNEPFAVFDGFDPDQYADEAGQRWGDTDAFQESARRTRHYSDRDWERYRAEARALNESLAAQMDQGRSANDPAVLELVEKMRLQVDRWFYPCSRPMHASLGEMYVADERFAATYEAIRPGMAVFLQQATAANLKRE